MCLIRMIMIMDYFFKNVKSIFENDDLSIVNLETTLTNAVEKKEKEFRFKGYPSFTNILKAWLNRNSEYC